MKPSNWIAGLGLILALTLALVPPEIYADGLTSDTVWTGALALATIVLFATAVVPEFITSIVFFAIAMLVALAPASVIFSGVQSAGFWMVFGGLVIGAGISSTGLAERLAYHVRIRFGSSYAGIIAGIMVVAAVSCGLAVVGALTPASRLLIIRVNLAFGACVFPLYGQFIALANAWVPPETRVAAASPLVLASSFGAEAAPLSIGLA